MLTSDVQSALIGVIRPGQPDSGESVIVVSEKSSVSQRTIYRVLKGDYDPLMDLDMADRLLMAVDAEIGHCVLVWPDGRVEWGY